MDLESTYLVGGVLVISAAILLIIDYLFKNKSYEEVVAEQMQQTRALYASQHRPKVKDKKQKKVAKKVKEKKNNSPKDSNNEEATDGHETTESQSESTESTKHHVEFKESSETEEPVKEVVISKKKVKKEAARPILVVKETSVEMIQLNSEASPANHFEESHPKDDFELLSSKEESAKDKKKNKQVAVDQDQPKNKKVSKQQAPEPVLKNGDLVEKQEPPTIVATEVPTVTNGVPPVIVKEKKKKKHDGGGLALNAGDKHGITLSGLLPLVRKAELSRVEVQNLIDILLTKQQDAPVIEEWSEGKGDPVQKLKKQLAEKEKQIVEMQDTLMGSQAKLKEVRSEQSNDRTNYLQTIRDLEEAVKTSKIEKQSLDNMLQTVTIKGQQLQEQYNEEVMKGRKIFEEYSNLQMQKQQIEMHLSQVREEEVSAAQLRTELQELQNRRTIENHAAEQNLLQVKQLQHQLNTYKDDIDKKDCRIRDIQELNLTLESRLNLLVHQEEELKSEINNLKADLQRSVEEARRLEHHTMQELQMLRSNKDEIEHENSKLISEVQKLKSQATALQQEKVSADQDQNRFKDEFSQLKDSNNSMKKEIALLKDEIKNLQEAKMNGLKEDKQQVAQLQSELATVKSQLQKLEDARRKEVDDLKVQHTKELEEQKKKNNELRQKNWKVMDALNVAESRYKAIEKQSKVMTTNTQTDEVQTKAMFIQRLFANHNELKSLPQDKCEELLKSFINDYSRNKNSSKKEEKSEDSNEVSKLKVKLEEYKKIIEETDSVLIKLQTDVKLAEITWRNELKEKDNQITRLTEMSHPEKKTYSPNNDEEVCQFQNACTNGPESALNDLTVSTNSSATSSIVDMPLKKNKKKKKKNGK